MTKPTDGAMRAVHMLDHDPYGTPDQRAAILDREAVAPAVRPYEMAIVELCEAIDGLMKSVGAYMDSSGYWHVRNEPSSDSLTAADKAYRAYSHGKRPIIEESDQ